MSNEQLGKRSNNTLPAQLTAEGTLDGDGLKLKFLPTGGHIAATPLAGDDEGFAA